MISYIDHIVITVSDVQKSLSFYRRVLKLEEYRAANGHKTLKFGYQKLDLRLAEEKPRNKARVGSADVCLISNWSIEEITKHLARENVPIIEGPVYEQGAVGLIQSLYIHDPDSNLIELSVYP